MSQRKKPSLWARLSAKKAAQSTIVGVAWYSEDNWARVKAAASDPDLFEATYSEWLDMATAALAQISKGKVKAVRCYILAEELQSWCDLHHKPINAGARAEFVSKQLQAQNKAL